MPRRTHSWVALVLIVAGLGTLAWTLTVLVWKDPFTSAYTAYRQHRLEGAFEEQVRAWETQAPPAPPAKPTTTATGGSGGSSTRNEPAPNGSADSTASERSPEPVERLGRRLGTRELERAGARYRAMTTSGDAIARLTIRRLGVSAIVVNGTDAGDLRSGPGRHLETFMPGEGRLVYIAGHRTTFSAPFSRIDRLVEGDEVRLTVPYATLRYRVTAHRIVDEKDLSVLEPGSSERLALQACHPRFFSSQRYIVYARLQEARAPT